MEKASDYDPHPMDEWIAIVCKRGHIATRIMEAYRFREFGEFCGECGARLCH